LPADLELPFNTGIDERLARFANKVRQGLSKFVKVNPDQKSIRAFTRRIPGDDREVDFYLMAGRQWTMTDSASASLWDFRGCALSGPTRGKCLGKSRSSRITGSIGRNTTPKPGFFS